MGKKIIILGLAALMLFMGNVLFAQTIVTLDQAIGYGVNEIGSRLEQGTKVVALNFISDSQRLSNYVLSEMTNLLESNGKLAVVERANLDFVLKELNYQRSGNINDETAQSIGRILGAQYVISGTIEESSSNYVIEFKTITVEPAALQTLTRVGVMKDAQITDLIEANTSSLQIADASSLTGDDNSSLNRILTLSAGGGAFIGMQISSAMISSSGNSAPTLVFGVPLFVNAGLFKYLALNLSLYYINTGMFESQSGAASFSVFGKIPVQLSDRFTLFPLLGVGYTVPVLSKAKGNNLSMRKGSTNDFVSIKPGIGLNYNLTGNLGLSASFISDLLLYNKNKSIKDGILLTPGLFIGVSYVFLRI